MYICIYIQRYIHVYSSPVERGGQQPHLRLKIVKLEPFIVRTEAVTAVGATLFEAPDLTPCVRPQNHINFSLFAPHGSSFSIFTRKRKF